MRVKTFVQLANRISEFTAVHVEENNRLNVSNRLLDSAMRAIDSPLDLASAINAVVTEISDKHQEMNLVNLKSTADTWDECALYGFLGIQKNHPFLLTEFGFSCFYDEDDFLEGIYADFGDYRFEIFGKRGKYDDWDVPCDSCREFCWHMREKELTEGKKLYVDCGKFRAKDFKTYLAKVTNAIQSNYFNLHSILPSQAS